MSRLAGRYTRKANSRTSGVGLQPRPEAVARAGRRLSVDAERRQFAVAGAGSVSGMNTERHDWLVPMELP
jgi:hypothetical protein